MIKISGVSKSFNGQLVLDDISLEVKENEILVILGESGTGKSVLLKNMIGLLKPDEGSIFIDSEDITKLSEKALLKIRKGIGYLFQEGALYDFMNVFENVAFPLKEHTSLKQQEIINKVQAVLKEIDLAGIERKYPSELSGGMKKRVALARAIILGSKILFCDEPTSGLDPIRSRDISDLIKDVSKRMGCSTVVTSHDIKNAFRIADRVALIHKGKIIAVGTPSDLKSSDDKFVREFILC
ncbi:MAG: ABC transporter ATP-binding protein [Omnitrophica WOR_2 bacterium GWF2_38_59]|nr:MAG: ABC transporter ATP-binding protein [Omnitrophica WOR_2 bacterium GWF2_38_59]OGX49703.1 MAG: ABC transporter ATP-binding protein [Omnitrophica WOR_2 bacterium RIFOXYA2_FULL_38_17]OGX52535.1 MAG: ABC transporter ATP-binding protein [Omnitrophica WOR_2 bacterium RIFOXYA12_FULL_38_10]OGX60152.1 MAG: ABC transporter ATP-binding protein [Omnitrophica WOR_2 bacterium RIFOXYB2_FULL_38_16]